MLQRFQRFQSANAADVTTNKITQVHWMHLAPDTYASELEACALAEAYKGCKYRNASCRGKSLSVLEQLMLYSQPCGLPTRSERNHKIAGKKNVSSSPPPLPLGQELH